MTNTETKVSARQMIEALIASGVSAGHIALIDQLTEDELKAYEGELDTLNYGNELWTEASRARADVVAAILDRAGRF